MTYVKVFPNKLFKKTLILLFKGTANSIEWELTKEFCDVFYFRLGFFLAIEFFDFTVIFDGGHFIISIRIRFWNFCK